MYFAQAFHISIQHIAKFSFTGSNGFLALFCLSLWNCLPREYQHPELKEMVALPFSPWDTTEKEGWTSSLQNPSLATDYPKLLCSIVFPHGLTIFNAMTASLNLAPSSELTFQFSPPLSPTSLFWAGFLHSMSRAWDPAKTTETASLEIAYRALPC